MSSYYFMRSRDVCMLERDWWDFGFALQDAFPEARYYRQRSSNRPEDQAQTPEPPELLMASHPLDAGVGPGDTVMMRFAPLWEPRWYKYQTRLGLAPEYWQWRFPVDPPPFVSFNFGGRIYDDPVPHPGRGDITFYGLNKNKEHLALASRFFRILGKHVTNRKGLVRVKVPSLEVTVPVESGSPTWCGHHAIEWAREAPDRVLFYVRAGFGTRPTGEVKPFQKKADVPSKRRSPKA
jgi:hypothetical protein